VAKCNFPVYLWSAFLELGAGVSQAALEKRMSSIKCGNCSTLIYTSGELYLTVLVSVDCVVECVCMCSCVCALVSVQMC
jgi:hypothetical protein